jgi:hypothetical protein
MESTKYDGVIDNVWECIDTYAKIWPELYGSKKCNSLDRNGKKRNKKLCYDDININKEN